MRQQQYFKWDGVTPVKVSWSKTRPKSIHESGNYIPGQGAVEANVARTLEDPDWKLYEKIFNSVTGILNDRAALNIPLETKNKWLHLWDGYCCETISKAEVYDALNLGYVSEYLTLRASNYMHLL